MDRARDLRIPAWTACSCGISPAPSARRIEIALLLAMSIGLVVRRRSRRAPR